MKIQEKNKIGRICIKMPLFPCCSTTFWKNQHLFTKTYLEQKPGYLLTQEAGILDDEGYLSVFGHFEEIIYSNENMAPHQYENLILTNSKVLECVVFSFYNDQNRGAIPIALVILSDSSKFAVSGYKSKLSSELKNMIKSKFGQNRKMGGVLVAEEILKSKDGRVSRTIIRRIFNGERLEDYEIAQFDKNQVEKFKLLRDDFIRKIRS